MLRFVPMLAGLAAFAIAVLFYLYDTPLYFLSLRTIGVKPWFHPFIDGEFMFAAKRCWLQGVDVYKAVPCDVVPGNKMAYSPLWLRLPFLSTDSDARVPVGLATDLLLICSVALLPPTRNGWETALISFAMVSTMVCFALERNNIDVWIFLIVVGGVLLIKRGGHVRVAGYALFMVVGLLKYYPLFLFGIALKERPARFWLICAASVTALAIFIATFFAELRESAANIPGGSPFVDMLGLVNVPRAIAVVAAVVLNVASRTQNQIELVLRLVLTAAVVAWAVRLSRRPGFAAAVGLLPEGDGIWLTAGCLVWSGCYVLTQSLGYRGIYLLIVLSGLLALCRVCDDKPQRRTLVFAAVSIVPVMWMEGFHQWATLLIDALVVPFPANMAIWGLVWVVRELLWLNLARIMLAVLFAVAAQSPAGMPLLARVRRFGLTPYGVRQRP